jgi:hypothetical protein
MPIQQSFSADHFTNLGTIQNKLNEKGINNFYAFYKHFWKGNGPIGQVKTSPETLLVYRAHPVMIVQKNCNCQYAVQGWEKLLKFEMYSSN